LNNASFDNVQNSNKVHLQPLQEAKLASAVVHLVGTEARQTDHVSIWHYRQLGMCEYV